MKKIFLIFILLFSITNIEAKKVYSDKIYTKYEVRVGNINNLDKYLRPSSTKILKNLFKNNELFKRNPFKLEITYRNSEKRNPFKRAKIKINGYVYNFLYIDKYKVYYITTNNRKDRYINNKFISKNDLLKLNYKKKIKIANPLDYMYVTSKFNLKRKHPVLGYIRPHRGIDYRAKIGTPVYAVSDGIVVRAKRYGTYGEYIKIKHKENVYSEYGHLSKYNCHKWKRVKKGDLIGYTGNTGRSTGPHLHFGLKINNEFVNPEEYFEKNTFNKKVKYLARKQNKYLKNRKLMLAIIKKEKQIDSF